MSLSIVAILVVACGSVIALAAKTGASGGTNGSTQSGLAPAPSTQVAAVRAGIDLLTADLKSALAINSFSPTSITFTTPPRGTDTTVENIAYNWAGAGQSLTRNYNSNGAVSIADSISSFNLTALNRTSAAPVYTESAEVLLYDYEPTSAATYYPTTTNWQAEYFNPSAALPANTVWWKITRVQINFVEANTVSLGNVNVAIMAADGSQRPIGPALGSGSVLVTLELVASWVNYAVGPLGNLTPGNGMTLVVSSSTTSSNANVSGVSSIASPVAGMSTSTSADGGNTWSTPTTSSALVFRVYGTYTTVQQ